MADTFKQYQGGIAPMQGISEAGARMGQMTQEGLMSFGKSLAEGIKGYTENAQKREVVDQQSQALGAQLQRYSQMMANNPDYAGLAEGLQPHIEALSKVPSMSLGSALGAVNGAQAVFQGLDREIALNDTIRKANIETGIGRAEGELPNARKQDIAAFAGSGTWRYDATKSYAQNELDFRNMFKAAQASDPTFKGDEEEAVAKWRSGVQGLAAGVQDEQIRATIFDQIEASRRNQQKAKDIKSEFEKSGFAAGVSKLAGMYGDESVGQDYQATTETTQALLNAKKAPPEGIDPAILETADKMLKTQAEELPFEQKIIDTQLKALRAARNDWVRGNKDWSWYDDAESIANHYLEKGSNVENPTGVKPEGLPNIYFLREIRPEIKGRKALQSLPEDKRVAGYEQALTARNDLGKILSDAYSKGFTTIGDSTQATRMEGVKVIDEGIADLEKRAKEKATPKTREQVIAELTGVKPEPDKPIAPLVGKENLQLGTTEQVTELTVAEKKANVAEYFRTKLGYVPSGFNEVYTKMHPESVLQTTKVNGQTLLWDGQKWTPMATEKALTVEEQMKLRSRQFGALDKNGKPMKTEVIPNSGIYAYGSFNSASTKKVDDFRQYTSDHYQVEEALNKLEELNNEFGGSLSPAARKQADQYKARIRSILKMEVANTGSVSDFEQKRIDDVTPAVNDLFALTGSNQASIDALRQKLRLNLTSTGAVFGVDIEIRSGANSTAAQIRQAKLDRARNQK